MHLFSSSMQAEGALQIMMFLICMWGAGVTCVSQQGSGCNDCSFVLPERLNCFSLPPTGPGVSFVLLPGEASICCESSVCLSN